MGDRVRIIIVDDHPVVREGLRTLLDREVDFEVRGDAGTSSEALILIGSESPHLAIVDVMLGDENGLDLMHRIKSLNSNIRMLACSMYDERLYAERALAAGALGYINKRAVIAKIIEAIRMVMAGEVFLSESMKQRIISRNLASRPIPKREPIDALSNRELEIFRLIGHGMTTTQIAELLELSTKTIESHRASLKKHLKLDSVPRLIREAAHWVLENG
jgi:DNA-binding NarL/FixJ family response regulator